MKQYTQLRHSEEGLASVSLQGDEFCITLGRALDLDNTHQVGGLAGGYSVWEALGKGHRSSASLHHPGAGTGPR